MDNVIRAEELFYARHNLRAVGDQAALASLNDPCPVYSLVLYRKTKSVELSLIYRPGDNSARTRRKLHDNLHSKRMSA